MENVLIALITAGIPAFVTLHSTKAIKSQANKHSARQSILQLILEDKMLVMEGKLPENHNAILEEFDEYTANGGNSYVHKKVDEYIKWYDNLTKEV